jgi:hypothetical protein
MLCLPLHSSKLTAPDTLGRWLAYHSGSLGVYQGPLIFQLARYWPFRWAGMVAGDAAAVSLPDHQDTTQILTP